MSEYEKESQPRPMFDDCGNCEFRYQMKPENSAVYKYAKQPECNFLFCVCPNCKTPSRIFIPDEDTLNEARANGLHVIEDEDYADQDIYESWFEAEGLVAPKEFELTDRQETIMRKFGDALMQIPDSLFWDNIEAETGKPYTNRWV